RTSQSSCGDVIESAPLQRDAPHRVNAYRRAGRGFARPERYENARLNSRLTHPRVGSPNPSVSLAIHSSAESSFSLSEVMPTFRVGPGSFMGQSLAAAFIVPA